MAHLRAERGEIHDYQIKIQTQRSLKANKVTLEAVRGERTAAELAQQYEQHPQQVTDWKRMLLTPAADVFDSPPATVAPAVDLKELHAKIGSSP